MPLASLQGSRNWTPKAETGAAKMVTIKRKVTHQLVTLHETEHSDSIFRYTTAHARRAQNSALISGDRAKMGTGHRRVTEHRPTQTASSRVKQPSGISQPDIPTAGVHDVPCSAIKLATSPPRVVELARADTDRSRLR
jgi:hypothetical protein